jgi:hypothetical protein
LGEGHLRGCLRDSTSPDMAFNSNRSPLSVLIVLLKTLQYRFDFHFPVP